jgi:hypothetical protein
VGLLASSKHSLLDLQQFDVEDEGAVRGDARKGLAAVCEVCGDGQSSLSTNGHASNTDIPALDDLTSSELEHEWLTRLVC